MKQHITVEQLNELSEKGKVKLSEWIRGKNHKEGGVFLPLLSIGQMIEFLMEHSMGDLDLIVLINNAGSSIWTGIDKRENKLGHKEELADALWSACKEVLEE